jgi:hypothetical protein
MSVIAWISIALFPSRVTAQFPLPPQVPIWDGNTVELKLHKVADGVYAIQPSTVEAETTKGIPQATSGGFIVGDKGVMLIEWFLNKKLFDQEIKLIRSVTVLFNWLHFNFNLPNAYKDISSKHK